MATLKHCCHALVAVAAAAAATAVAAAAVSARDDIGVLVALPAPAKRIVSLAPHATEMLFAAGTGGAVVGVVAHSDHPPEANAIARVGDAIALDMERIVALAPDLVVTWPWSAPNQVAQLRARGVPIYTLEARTIGGIADNIERLAVLAGTTAAAAPTVAQWRWRLQALESRPVPTVRKRVFYQLGDAPMYTVGGPQLITQAIRLCGGRNVFAALSAPAPLVDVEAVVAARPQVIIAGTEGAKVPPWLSSWQRFPALPAVQAGNLLTVDAFLLHRPGPRFIDGVEQLCGVMDRTRAPPPDPPSGSAAPR